MYCENGKNNGTYNIPLSQTGHCMRKFWTLRGSHRLYKLMPALAITVG
jgi:hypothetical protein